MSVPFVGEGHRELVDDLVAEFEAVCSRQVPSWLSLEANTGWGKTRVVQEFYARLAALQPEPRYWPPSILTPAEESVNVQRKRVHPALAKASDDALPSWFWWGISCSLRDGTPLNALVHDLERFDERRDAIERRFRELSSGSTRLKDAFQRRKSEVSEAAIGDAVGAAASLASVAVPGIGLLVLLGKWGIGHARAERQRRVDDDARTKGEPRSDLVGDVAPQLERFASFGIPLLIVIEDIHEADEALIELVARVLAAKSAPVFVLTTSWRGMIDQPHRAAHRLLERVEEDHRRRVLCETEVADLSREDLGKIVDAVLPAVDATSRDRLAERFPNPYSLQLACQTRVVRRSAATGSIPADVVANLPHEVDDLFRQLWGELPEPLRRALSVASQLTPGSVSSQIGFGDLRWDPELMSMAVERVKWLAEDLPELADYMRDARDAYAWVRTVDEWLQRFHDPVQHEIAANALRDEYRPEEQLELRRAAGEVASALTIDDQQTTGERAINRDRLLVALASEGLVAWNEHAAQAASRVCGQCLMLGGSTELHLAIEICQRALRDSTCGIDETSALRALEAACLAGVGRTSDAIDNFQLLLDDQMRVLGTDAPGTLVTRNNIAGWLGETGRVAEAIDQFQRLLDDQTRILGADAPTTLITRSNLTRYLGESGRVTEAIEQYRKLLNDLTRVLGPDARDTLTVRSGLAHFVGERGDVNEAIELNLLLRDDQARVLGTDAPDTLTTRDNLASLLREAGRVQDAIEQFQSLLDDENRVLGPDAPATLATRSNLADLIGQMGDVGTALDQLHRLLEDQARVLGHDSPATLTTRGHIAGWTGQAGRIEEAIEQMRQLLADERRVCGSDARSTLTTWSNLAFWLSQKGQLNEASRELQQVLRAQSAAFGPDDPDVLANRTNLAEWLAKSGQVTEALAEFHRLVDACTRVLGPNAPKTLFARSNLASCVAMNGDVKEAIAQFEKLLDDHRRVLSQDDRAALLPRTNLAYYLVRDGRVNEGIQEYHNLLDAQARVFGLDAPEALQTRDVLAHTLADDGRMAEAAEQLVELIEAQTRVEGSDAPMVFATRYKLAGVIARSGRITQAVEQLRRLSEDVTRALGAEASLAKATRDALAALLANDAS